MLEQETSQQFAHLAGLAATVCVLMIRETETVQMHAI